MKPAIPRLCVISCLTAALTVITVAAAAQSGNPALGERRLQTEVCQECHGSTGISTSPYAPKLAGQWAPYMVKQIHDFQSGARKHPIMTVLAEGLNDDKLQDIAAFFAAAAPVKDEPADTNAVGRRLFQAGDSVRAIPACNSCHGPDGVGRNDEETATPRIGGQRKGYLINQLLAWRNGDRKNSPDGTMNMIAHLLSDSEIQQVAGYIAGL